MLALDKLLSALDVRVEAFAICEITPGWRLNFGPAAEPSVHYVLTGSGSMRIPDQPPRRFSTDCFIVLPKGLAHSFEAEGDNGQEIAFTGFASEGDFDPNIRPVRKIRAGEGKYCLAVACGTIRATYGGSIGLFDRLKTPILESFADQPLRDRFKAVLDELTTPTVGTQALTESFLKQALVLLMRRQSGAHADSLPWLAALRDKRLAPALTAMLDQPSDSHTLDQLARLAGMSRSAFAEHFATTLGHPPIEFLKQLRLGRAARLLETSDLPVKAIAKNVGYDSRSYFSRAFRARYGVDPTEYRGDSQGD